MIYTLYKVKIKSNFIFIMLQLYKKFYLNFKHSLVFVYVSDEKTKETFYYYYYCIRSWNYL